MPAVHSKVIFDSKSIRDDGNTKVKGSVKTRNKERSASRKKESPMERSAPQSRKVFVPELDLKSLASKLQSKIKVQAESQTQVKIHSPIKTAVMSPKKRKASKSALNPEFMVSERESYRSLFSISAREESITPMHSLGNLNPNQLPDDYFDCNEADDYYRNQYPDFENTSELGYETPKLPSMKSLTSRGCKHSPEVLHHFKELLHQEETSRTNLLQQSEISLLKDIVKTDERHRRLQRDDYELLKEILLGQLKEICQQERVIKLALKKIRTHGRNEVEVTTLKVDTAEQPMEDAHSKPRTPKASNSHRTPRQEVDVIFRNVPSLEKEIQILRTLGLKLEETLNKSNDKNASQRAIILHEVQKRHIAHSMHHASGEVHSKGTQVLSGEAREFEIRHQTLDELKLEREFYIPTDIVNFTLQRTDFHKLSRNPELLLRRLKPLTKGTPMKFNLIEQDPMFFNHFLTKMCSIYGDTAACYQTYFPQSLEFHEKLPICRNGSGDNPGEEPHELTVCGAKSLSNISIKKRGRKKRRSTPMPDNKEAPAKNRLLRNVLFGAVQVSILLALATAVWYPDMICL